jgi:hypothetical protein
LRGAAIPDVSGNKLCIDARRVDDREPGNEGDQDGAGSRCRPPQTAGRRILIDVDPNADERPG